MNRVKFPNSFEKMIEESHSTWDEEK